MHFTHLFHWNLWADWTSEWLKPVGKSPLLNITVQIACWEAYPSIITHLLRIFQHKGAPHRLKYQMKISRVVIIGSSDLLYILHLLGWPALYTPPSAMWTSAVVEPLILLVRSMSWYSDSAYVSSEFLEDAQFGIDDRSFC
jgi:hypothetical protein